MEREDTYKATEFNSMSVRLVPYRMTVVSLPIRKGKVRLKDRQSVSSAVKPNNDITLI